MTVVDNRRKRMTLARAIPLSALLIATGVLLLILAVAR